MDGADKHRVPLLVQARQEYFSSRDKDSLILVAGPWNGALREILYFFL